MQKTSLPPLVRDSYRPNFTTMEILKNVFYCFLVFGFAQSCKLQAAKHLTIEYQKTLDSIPSASGMAIMADTAYIICDDGTGIYKLTINDFRLSRISIHGLPFDQYREAKAVKHDFESACFVNWQGANYLLAFGSGSNETSRDSLLFVNMQNYADQGIVSLQAFYDRLRQHTNTGKTEWNIEGATIAANQLIIANRGNNVLISCRADQFISWVMRPGTVFPEIRYSRITLPEIEKHEARLSGICTIDENHLLFCASVEDTPDWTKDGPVLGSYFGIYSLKDNKLKETYLLKDDHDRPLKEKIESVEILQRNPNGGFTFLALADNDSGSSSLFRLKL